MNNTQSASIAPNFFNLHMDGCGNLYNARLVSPSQGRRFQPFLAVRVALLQGPSASPDATFVSLKVVGKKAIKVIEHYMEAINNRDQKTFASVKFGDIEVEINPNAKEGHQPFFMKGRLINVKYLKVGDEVIDLDTFDEPVALIDAQQSPANSTQYGEVVTLDASLSDFEYHREQLQLLNYHQSETDGLWYAPAAALPQASGSNG